MRKVVIVGVGGFGRETLDIFEASCVKSDAWQVLGFLDDNREMHGKTIRGYPVLGGTDWFSNPEAKDVSVVVAIGDNKTRKRVVEKVKAYGVEFCNIVHPTTVATRHLRIGEGVIIAAGCIFTNNIEIGSHVIINLGVTVGHDTIIEDFVNLNPGVHINGSNRVLEGAYIGSGAVTIQNITIGKWSVIGAGAVVVKDVPERVVAVGVPAKPLRQIEEVE